MEEKSYGVAMGGALMPDANTVSIARCSNPGYAYFTFRSCLRLWKLKNTIFFNNYLEYKYLIF